MRYSLSDTTLLNGCSRCGKAVHVLKLSADDSRFILHGDKDFTGEKDVETAAK